MNLHRRELIHHLRPSYRVRPIGLEPCSYCGGVGKLPVVGERGQPAKEELCVVCRGERWIERTK